LKPDGSNLATVLAWIQAETRTESRPKGALADIVADLSSLIPGVVDLNIEEDTTNREYRVGLSMREEFPFSSRVVSDGTLRLLAFLTLLHDPKYHGLVCFEEPENGVHHSRLKAMIRRLREWVSNPFSKEVDEQEPLSQMLLNSHSPVVLSELQQGEIMFSDILTVVDPIAHQRSRITRMRPVLTQEQGELKPDSRAEFVSIFEVNRYLSSVNPES